MNSLAVHLRTVKFPVNDSSKIWLDSLLFCTTALVSPQKFCLKLHEILALVKIPVRFNHSGNDHNAVPLETVSYLRYDWLCLTSTMWDKLVPEATENSAQDDTLQLLCKQDSSEDGGPPDTMLYLHPSTWAHKNTTADSWDHYQKRTFSIYFWRSAAITVL